MFVESVVEVFRDVLGEVAELQVRVFVEESNFPDCRRRVDKPGFFLFFHLLAQFLRASSYAFQTADDILFKDTFDLNLFLLYFLIVLGCLGDEVVEVVGSEVVG